MRVTAARRARLPPRWRKAIGLCGRLSPALRAGPRVGVPAATAPWRVPASSVPQFVQQKSGQVSYEAAFAFYSSTQAPRRSTFPDRNKFRALRQRSPHCRTTQLDRCRGAETGLSRKPAHARRRLPCSGQAPVVSAHARCLAGPKERQPSRRHSFAMRKFYLFYGVAALAGTLILFMGWLAEREKQAGNGRQGGPPLTMEPPPNLFSCLD